MGLTGGQWHSDTDMNLNIPSGAVPWLDTLLYCLIRSSRRRRETHGRGEHQQPLLVHSLRREAGGERHPEEVEGRAGGTQPPPNCVLHLQTDDDKWEDAGLHCLAQA